MTGFVWLDWALVTASLFNVIVLLWLGLTVLLNVERRSLGVWLMGMGLLAGAAFFISHTAILGHELAFSGLGANFWWRVGWLPIVAAPFAWYMVALWYAGFWHAPRVLLYRRHLPWLILTGMLGVALVSLTLVGLPSFTQVAQLDLSAWPAIGGIPLVFVLYPVFMVACFLLAISALRNPAPSERMMGDLARQRTRPWLVGAAILLLAVSLLVTGFIWWTTGSARANLTLSPMRLYQYAARFDLAIELLIMGAILLMGQGIVAYEVFTGHTLPRRGFARHWRDVIILAAGYGMVVGWTIAFRLQPVYSLLLTTILMVTFYALFSWRSFVEREQFMARLRPFVGSQCLMESLLDLAEPSHSRAEIIFQALCQEVLNVQRAQLVPLGTLAPLAGKPLHYPLTPSGELVLPPANLFASPCDRLVALATEQHALFTWAVPLWADRGPIGALLLGEKLDGGLYTQEEIDIARATGERIMDMLAGEEMARRLMELQRRHLAETQIVDRRARRTLHDEVLPELHAALLQLTSQPGADPAVENATKTLMGIHHRVADLIRDLPGTPTGVPGGDLMEAIRQLVEVEYAAEFDGVSWHLHGALPRLLPLVQETIYHAIREAIRNAALHGRGKEQGRPLHLTIRVACEERLAISIADDGVGFSRHERQSASRDGEPSVGASEGLALHSTMMAVIGGSLTITSPPEGGTEVTIELALSEGLTNT